MINPEKQRIEAKLKLWETPGFFQFIEDLNKYMEVVPITTHIEALKRLYIKRLKELNNTNSKFKQGKLPL